MKQRLIKYGMVFVSVLCMLCSVVSYAASRTHALQIKFITDAGPVVGANFKLYYVMSTDGALYGDFADLQVEVGDLTDSENLSSLASTLASYAADGTGKPVAEKNSDALGHADFSDLESGIYLMTGSSGKIGNTIYIPKPALLRITELSYEKIDVNVKYTMLSDIQKVSYTVKKVWENDESTDRPESVTVQLLRDDEIYDKVTLSSENNWTHTWDDLSADYEWNVVETNIPSGYSVTVTLEENTFTVTNRWTTSSEATTTTDTTDVTTTEPSTTTITPPPTTTITGSKTDKLPQTGQLWYPVCILFISGLLLFLIGFVSKRLSDDNEKE